MRATPAVRRTRRMLHRCSAIGRRCGPSARNSSMRLRPSRFNAARSCDGLATPRAAAKASAISSSVKMRRARR